MKRNGRSRWTGLVLASALASVALPLTAQAQYRTGNDGRVRDANNRLGSSGYNEGYTPPSPVTGNQIVTGNVTGGRGFQGPITYTDPRDFRGPTAGQSMDRFIAGSSGVPQSNAAPNDLTTPRPFYGASQTVTPPPGFVREGTTGGYVPAPTLAPQPQDLRLGQALDANSPAVTLPQPGTLSLPGPVNPSPTPFGGGLSASPLYGIRPWTPNSSDQYFAPNLNQQPETAIDRLQLNQADIIRMRQELQANPVAPPTPAQPGEESQPNTSGLPTNSSLNPPMNLAPQSLKPLESPLDASLAPKPLGAQLEASALPGTVGTEQGMRQNLLLSPTQQSAQYAEMRRRLEQQHGQRKLTDEEANRLYREQVRIMQEAEAKTGAQKGGQPALPGRQPMPNQPGVLTPGQVQPAPKSGPEGVGLPDYQKMAQETMQRPPEKMPALPSPPPPGATAKPEPLRVSSLAEGVKAKGLAELLIRAEDLMKQGKFTSALDQYDAAERVAPNNRLIALGRANAELGAGYYARAEADLREAFTSDPTLLMGQYDLRTMLGEDRLEFITKDLKTIAKTESTQPRPLFLLAYIAYNTANERLVSSYLDMAEKRAGGQDPLYRLLRQHWALPAAAPETPVPDANK